MFFEKPKKIYLGSKLEKAPLNIFLFLNKYYYYLESQ